MNDSSSDPPSGRPTLKLKVGGRKPPEKPVRQPAPAATQSKSSQKPGAQWSDEYKERMQADMDALARR